MYSIWYWDPEAGYSTAELLYIPTLADEYPIISPICTLELSKAGSMEFLLPPMNPAYDKLQKLKTVVELRYGDDSDYEIIFRGRVLHDEKDFWKRKNVYCEGVLAYLLDSVIHPYIWQNTVAGLFRKFITEHNSQVDDWKKFTVRTVDVVDPNDYIYKSSYQYPKTYNEIVEKLVNSVGGYLFPVYNKDGTNSLDYVTASGSVSDQVIMFGENLLDITEYISAENIYTVIIPLGAKIEKSSEDEESESSSSEGTEEVEERLTIESVNGGLDYLENTTAIRLFGRIVEVVKWDDVNVASILKSKGQQALNAAITLAVTLSIRAVDMHFIDVDTDHIRLGWLNRVVSVPHGLDSFFDCSKIVLNILNTDKSEYTFGAGFQAMTDKQVAAMKTASQAYNTAQDASATANAAGAVTVDIQGNYVSKSEWTRYQTAINNELAQYSKTSDLQRLIPTALKNPYPLKFTGAISRQYDGSEEVTVELANSSGSAGKVLLWSTTLSGNLDCSGTCFSPAIPAATLKQYNFIRIEADISFGSKSTRQSNAGFYINGTAMASLVGLIRASGSSTSFVGIFSVTDLISLLSAWHSTSGTSADSICNPSTQYFADAGSGIQTIGIASAEEGYTPDLASGTEIKIYGY